MKYKNVFTIFVSIDVILKSMNQSTIKDIFYSFLFSIDFLFIYVYCRKFNAEFNKLIKTVGHCACFFEKRC